ncbi:hypothetical protein, partial [Bergeriella denitrificans]|uniref:hypothetical protein n=1 Tax=Bergeriella denitrificans TaxID=494 RepID=UPI001C3FE670
TLGFLTGKAIGTAAVDIGKVVLGLRMSAGIYSYDSVLGYSGMFAAAALTARKQIILMAGQGVQLMQQPKRPIGWQY